MTDNPVFIDANVLLEALLKDRPYAEAAQQYISANHTIISPLTIHLTAYFGQKDGLPLNVLLELLAKYQFTDFGPAEILWASANHQDDDFEDALQVACAVLSGAKLFATLDKNLAQNYGKFIKVKVLLPQET